MLQSDAREAEQGEHQIAFALAAARFHRVALERVQRAESRFQAGEERLVFPIGSVPTTSFASMSSHWSSQARNSTSEINPFPARSCDTQLLSCAVTRAIEVKLTVVVSRGRRVRLRRAEGVSGNVAKRLREVEPVDGMFLPGLITKATGDIVTVNDKK